MSQASLQVYAYMISARLSERRWETGFLNQTVHKDLTALSEFFPQVSACSFLSECQPLSA